MSEHSFPRLLQRGCINSGRSIDSPHQVAWVSRRKKRPWRLWWDSRPCPWTIRRWEDPPPFSSESQSSQQPRTRWTCPARSGRPSTRGQHTARKKEIKPSVTGRDYYEGYFFHFSDVFFSHEIIWAHRVNMLDCTSQAIWNHPLVFLSVKLMSRIQSCSIV